MTTTRNSEVGDAHFTHTTIPIQLDNLFTGKIVVCDAKTVFVACMVCCGRIFSFWTMDLCHFSQRGARSLSLTLVSLSKTLDYNLALHGALQ